MGSTPRPTSPRWRKSTYSGDQAACVECVPLGPLAWRKSTYSGDQADCVEVAELPTPALLARDSKNPTGPHLTLDPATFTTFLNWAAMHPS
ncbi:DUF397 domain-containing protein [Streptomyces adelaidensis]|uniref:DUF397 domain-containing protein n=1 Tax=Streptomyces adelaidensis TaxID=2796465 RepID=UPI00190466BF|nr:DUF397 domain-containing protein [Streptomyces adelaidensis]